MISYNYSKSARLLLLFLLLSTMACKANDPIVVAFKSRNNNVCKELRGKVVLYTIFVDTRHTNPWSKYDIESTLDSIHLAMNWIMQKAREDSIYLDIQIAYHQNEKGTIPIYNDLPKKTLSETLLRRHGLAGIKDIYRWSDRIASEAGKSLPKDSSAAIKTPNNMKDRERLIARLRDIHRTDNVALMYFINNYYTDEISVAIDTQNDHNVEFSIVSFKYPSVIAHEFLHLFGAWDLYITPFDKDKNVRKRKKIAMELFPNEIMAFAYRNLESLEISPFTKYAIGWSNELDSKYSKLILGKKLQPLKY